MRSQLAPFESGEVAEWLVGRSLGSVGQMNIVKPRPELHGFRRETGGCPCMSQQNWSAHDARGLVRPWNIFRRPTVAATPVGPSPRSVRRLQDVRSTSL